MDQLQPLAGASQPMGDAPAKPRTVDRDDRIGPHFPDRPHGLAHPPQDQRHPRQYLGDSGHRQIGERHKTGEALLRHSLAADSGKLNPAGPLAQGRDQRPAEGVPRRLAGDNEDEWRGLAVPGHDRLVIAF